MNLSVVVMNLFTLFCTLPLPAGSSLMLMPHNQLISNVNQLLTVVALASFTEPITN